MEPGELYVDLRDRTVVKIIQVLPPAKESTTPLVRAADYLQGYEFHVDAADLSPRAVDPESILDWLTSV